MYGPNMYGFCGAKGNGPQGCIKGPTSIVFSLTEAGLSKDNRFLCDEHTADAMLADDRAQHRDLGMVTAAVNAAL